ncbi:MAG: PIN domain-containing protein [Chloroflexota bacterium]
MTALLDTDFLLALLARNDHLHDVCAMALDHEPEPLVPNVILPELAYLIVRDMGYQPFLRFMDAVLAGSPPLVMATAADYTRATEMMSRYADSRIDFVDCVIAAVAERLKVTRILSLDHRHFSLFRPDHCDTFEVVP